MNKLSTKEHNRKIRKDGIVATILLVLSGIALTALVPTYATSNVTPSNAPITQNIQTDVSTKKLTKLKELNGSSNSLKSGNISGAFK